MTRLSCILACVLLLAAACRRPQAARPRSLADSALAVHFGQLKTLRHYDTSGFGHRLLQAIYRGDSAFLRQYLEAPPEQVADRRITLISDSSMGLPPLHALGADAAYRIQTESANSWTVNGSPMYNVRSYTMRRAGDTVRLRVLYALYEQVGPDADGTFRTTIQNRHDTMLTLADWKALEEALRYCDFWGLKPSNDVHGNDGWTLSIEGYRRPAPGTTGAHHYVYRVTPNDAAVNRSLEVMERLGGGNLTF